MRGNVVNLKYKQEMNIEVNLKIVVINPALLIALNVMVY